MIVLVAGRKGKRTSSPVTYVVKEFELFKNSTFLNVPGKETLQRLVEGEGDAALVGTEALAEFGIDGFHVQPLPSDLGTWHLSLLAKSGIQEKDIKHVISSYPKSATRILSPSVRVSYTEGQEEWKVVEGVADACVCVYSTGTTAQQAGLVLLRHLLPCQFNLVQYVE